MPFVFFSQLATGCGGDFKRNTCEIKIALDVLVFTIICDRDGQIIVVMCADVRKSKTRCKNIIRC